MTPPAAASSPPTTRGGDNAGTGDKDEPARAAATAGLGRRPRYPSRGWSGPRRGDGDRDGDVDNDGDGDVDRGKDEDGDRDGAGNAVRSPPPSLQVAKAGEGGNTAEFWRCCGWGRYAGMPLDPPTLGLGHPGHGVPVHRVCWLLWFS